jgi:single-stranded DNA-specific DHH superfamily exonuclease
MINWKRYYKLIPATVKLGDNTYEICWVDEFPRDRKQLGESRFEESKQILINLNQPIKEAVHTYWHEVLHGLSFEYDAELTEKQVLALEKGLSSILKSGNLFRKELKNGKTIKRKRRNS